MTRQPTPATSPSPPISTAREPYRPSNGSEGDGFFSNWCDHCARDKVMNGTYNFDDAGPLDTCAILTATFHYSVTDPQYPHEWRYDAAGAPCCTAFIPFGDTIPHVDLLTGDLFSCSSNQE